MKIEITNAQWLIDNGEVTLEELVELSGLSPELLRELVDYGALDPVEAQPPAGARPQTEVRSTQFRFSAECVVAVQAVSRLREDFELDANALSVALMLIERIHGLEAQLQEMQSQLPRLKKWGQTR